MTRTEAIGLLSGLMFKGKLKEALDMAIKALEQEPILDKIRAEIDEHIEFNKKMNYMGIVGGLLLAKDIIDKYKAEIEPQESEET